MTRRTHFRIARGIATMPDPAGSRWLSTVGSKVRRNSRDATGERVHRRVALKVDVKMMPVRA